MSAIGPKRTSLVAPHMSAFGGKADMRQVSLLTPLQSASVPSLRRSTEQAPVPAHGEQLVRDLSSRVARPPFLDVEGDDA
jgi:hypothetical protein